MTYRKSPQKTAATRTWQSFVTSNAPLFEAAAIPPVVHSSIDHFDDFLSHGHLDHHEDPSNFRVDSLDARQYEALVMLTESYFDAGYEWFTPLALRPADQDRLRHRFE